MQNQHKQVICEHDHIILNDGVTIYPGYIELTKEGMTIFNSLDPNNDSPSLGVLKNRIQDENGNSFVISSPAPEGVKVPKVKKTMHFCNLRCMNEFFASEKKSKKRK